MREVLYAEVEEQWGRKRRWKGRGGEGGEGGRGNKEEEKVEDDRRIRWLRKEVEGEGGRERWRRKGWKRI